MLPALHEGLGHRCFSDAGNHGKRQPAQVTGTPSLALKSSTSPRARTSRCSRASPLCEEGGKRPGPPGCQTQVCAGRAAAWAQLVPEGLWWQGRGRQDAGGQRGKHPPAYQVPVGASEWSRQQLSTGRGRYFQQGSSGSYRPRACRLLGPAPDSEGNPGRVAWGVVYSGVHSCLSPGSQNLSIWLF